MVIDLMPLPARFIKNAVDAIPDVTVGAHGKRSKINRRDADSVAALGVDARGRKRQLLDFGDLLVELFALGLFAHDFGEALLVDDDGDGNVVDLVALACGRRGFRADLVVRRLFLAVLRFLVLIFSAAGGFIRNVLLDADGRLSGSVLRALRLLHCPCRALDL